PISICQPLQSPLRMLLEAHRLTVLLHDASESKSNSDRDCAPGHPGDGHPVATARSAADLSVLLVFDLTTSLHAGRPREESAAVLSAKRVQTKRLGMRQCPLAVGARPYCPRARTSRWTYAGQSRYRG